MIVAERKPFEDIKAMLADAKKILVAGCGTCTAVCHAGGEKEVEILASQLRMSAQKEGQELDVGQATPERQCEPEFLEGLVEKVNAENVEAVLSLACGVGVNMLAERLEETPVFPGLDTSFYGGVVEEGLWKEYCAGCGDCILHLTGGICPIARCSKTLLNGPCGGTNEGKCEINPDTDCAWYLIVKRAEKLGTLEALAEYRPPRDWSGARHGGPRRLIVEHLREKPAEEDKV